MTHSKAAFSLQSEYFNIKIKVAHPSPITIPLISKEATGIARQFTGNYGLTCRSAAGIPRRPRSRARDRCASAGRPSLRATPSGRKIADFKK
jgi:hypothetical protein